MGKLKDLTTFILCYIYSRIFNKTFVEITLPIIFGIIDLFKSISRGINSIVFTTIKDVLIFALYTVTLKVLYRVVNNFLLVKKNENAGLFRYSGTYTMLPNKKLRGEDKETIKKELEYDYKEILDYGLDKYSKGIKITTNDLVVRSLIKMKYGNRVQYRKCKVGRKYIIKEKFYMLTFKQFIKYLIALTNQNNNYYIDAKKYIKPRDKYKFIIRYDKKNNNNIIVEPN